MEVRGFGEFQTTPVGVIFIYMSVQGFLGVSLCLGNKKKNTEKIKSLPPPFETSTDCSNCTLGHVMVMLVYFHIVSVMYKVNLEWVMLLGK